MEEKCVFNLIFFYYDYFFLSLVPLIIFVFELGHLNLVIGYMDRYIHKYQYITGCNVNLR